MRWKNFGEATTEEEHKAFFGGKEDKHEHGVGFLIHKDIMSTVMGCRPVCSRLITIRLRAVLFNITIEQAYVPTSDYDDKEIEEFWPATECHWSDTEEGHSCVQGDWNAKVGKDAWGNWQSICGPFYNDDTNERGIRLLEFATFNDLVLANTFGHPPQSIQKMDLA